MARMRISLVAATATIAALAAPTTAAAVTTGCAGLQEAFDDPANAVVTLSEGAECHGHFTLPNRTIIFEGAGSGATLDGDNEDQILSGDSVGATTIRNLTFVDGFAVEGDGGAIEIEGDSPVTLEGNEFFSNEAEDDGGAVDLELDNQTLTADAARGAGPPVVLRGNTFGGADQGNVAEDEGGAVYIDGFFRTVVVEDNTFSDNLADDDDGGGLEINAANNVTLDGNTFTRNEAGHNGGGASVHACTAEITDNVFDSNAIVRANVNEESVFEGGGLFLDGANCRSDQATRGVDSGAVATQSGNRFTSNAIHADFEDAAGGGEHVQDMEVVSTNDRFVGNVIENVDEAYGGGLSFASSAGQSFTARNLVAAGNRIVETVELVRGGDGPPHSGGGLALIGNQSALRVEDSTIEGNSAARGSGIGGQVIRSPEGSVNRSEVPFELAIHNSIVFGNTGSAVEIEGLFLPDVRSSDVCLEGGPAPDGDGAAPNSNICENPGLAAPNTDGNVDQSAGSPTRDAGDNALVDPDLAQDYAGDGRVLDGDADGTARVDMGADEYKPVTAEPTPEPTVQPPAAQPAPQGAVQGQTQRSCRSKRVFRIRIRVPRGKKARSATVRVNNKKVKVVRGKRLKAPVLLRGLPKGRFTVRITVRLTNGKKITGKRTYHTCIPKLPGDGPPKV